MYLKIGTHQRGAIYNLFTNHNSKCVHTYLVCNTVLLNIYVCEMYFIIVVFVRKLSKDMINVSCEAEVCMHICTLECCIIETRAL